jgi:hypothetical protein
MITTMFGFLAASARTASLGNATAAVSIPTVSTSSGFMA